MRSNSITVLVLRFEEEHDLLQGLKTIRGADLKVLDVFTPYPVHGLSDVLGMPPSRLPISTFFFGAFGALAILWLQYWASATDWPLNVAGKPYNSLPAFFPAIFEMMVLFAGYGSVFVLFMLCGLWFGRRPRRNYHGATSDRHVVLVQESAMVRTEGDIRALLGDAQPETVVQEVWEGLHA